MSGKKLINYLFIFSLFSIFLTFCSKEEPTDISEFFEEEQVESSGEYKVKTNGSTGGGSNNTKQITMDDKSESISGQGVLGILASKRSAEQHMVNDFSVAGGVSGLRKRHAPKLNERSIYNSADQIPVDFNTESYDRIYENPYLAVIQNPLSTFSIDVDAASYANIRRFINNNQMPPKDAVRIEEMINYFSYKYPDPDGNHPFSIYTEMSDCPWNKNHKLVHIGLQGEKIKSENTPPSNLVFLLDVSGSMSSPNKLPLLKKSFRLLVNQLKESDQISIVVYAGAAGLILPPTSGSKKTEILNALDQLHAGGSTAGGAGIQLAYKIAKDNLIEDGNNRVILATDGDFNIGVSSDGEMVRMIEEKRNEGIFLTVLGFGMGNYKDSKMEKLADKGNGNYAYIDNILEAKKVFVNELGSTLFTIAKDVKIQIEFNPSKVSAYRLIGYENRMLRAQDFNDDKKDAGELGSGHTVTALYEIVPSGVKTNLPKVDSLKYQQVGLVENAGKNDEWLTVKFRYKNPKDSVSNLIVMPLADKFITIDQTSNNFRFSAAIAAFGMILRDSKHKGDFTFNDAFKLAKNSIGDDKFGYRSELLSIIEKGQLIAGK